MSNKIIGINEYGSFAKNEKNENVCHKCMYFNYHKHVAPCKSCLEVYYYPNHLEIAKLEAELTPETFTINDMYVTSKQLFDCQDELKASQKELIDLQVENKQLKERVKELENTISDEEVKEHIENALYSTHRFLTTQCTDLAIGIIQYIKEANILFIKNQK